MRVFILVVLSLVVGLSLGIGSTWARYGWITSASDLAAAAGRPRPAIAPQFAPEHGPQPKVVVDKEDFDFGAVERDATVRHEFLISNQGDYELVLQKGGTSCMKCTIANLPKSLLQPGESVSVAVEYHAAIPNGPFRQMAIILTNDRARPRVELSVEGRVTSSFRAMPEELALSTFSAGEPKSGEFRLLSYVSDNFTVESHEMLDPETANAIADAPTDVTMGFGEMIGEPGGRTAVDPSSPVAAQVTVIVSMLATPDTDAPTTIESLVAPGR